MRAFSVHGEVWVQAGDQGEIINVLRHHQATRHSECPTAMQEGVLGRVKPGQLFPSLEKALFALAEGEMSDIVESPLGMHLSWCEQIHPTETLPFRQVSDKLRDHLEQKARKRYLKRWLQQPTN